MICLGKSFPPPSLAETGAFLGDERHFPGSKSSAAAQSPAGQAGSDKQTTCFFLFVQREADLVVPRERGAGRRQDL